MNNQPRRPQTHVKKQSQQQPDTKSINYKSLLAQYYDKNPQLSDVYTQLKAITPDIDILTELNEFEKQIDSLIRTKRYDVQEIYMKPPKMFKRILRLTVKVETKQAQKVIKIIGRLLDPSNRIQNIQKSPKFTSFFKQIKIFKATEDKSILLNWKKPLSNFSERDGITCALPFEQIEDQQQNTYPISIIMSQVFNPPRFEVDQNLRKIINLKRGTRVEILQAFWQYIKLKKLQDVQNKEIVNADELVKNAFKTQKLTIATINNRIRELLVPVENIKIEMNAEQTKKVFDMIVLVQQRPQVDIVPFFSQKINEQKNDHPYLSLNSKIKKYEKKFQDHTQKLRRHLAKRDIYMNFKAQQIQNIIKEQYELLKKLKKTQPVDQYNKLQFILQNEEQVEKEIKHYLEQINIQKNQHQWHD